VYSDVSEKARQYLTTSVTLADFTIPDWSRLSAQGSIMIHRKGRWLQYAITLP
jgi:hypothetical protein